LRDPINFGFNIYGTLKYVALEILKLNSTDAGYNKYQGIPFDSELQCNYTILPYGN
jgi:hypothetical protein